MEYHVHPLINPNAAKQYDSKEEPTIFEIERSLSVTDLIGACSFNILKYTMRTKDQDRTDLEKARDYTLYRFWLRNFKTRTNKNLHLIPLCDAMDASDEAWKKP